MAVQDQKAFQCDKGRALIAIHKGVVARNRQGIKGAKGRNISRAVSGMVYGAREGAFGQGVIANT